MADPEQRISLFTLMLLVVATVTTTWLLSTVLK
jgi:hypothetical protein